MLKTRLSVDNGNLGRRSSGGNQSGGGKVLAGTRGSSSGGGSQSNPVTANALGVGSPTSVAGFGGIQYNTMFRGILPDSGDDAAIGTLLRDIYMYDNVGGSAVDLMSGLPFSNWTLIGVDQKKAEEYNEALSRINMRTLLPEVSNSYLVDGAFIGTLLWDAQTKVFQDVLIHDRNNANISTRPFFAVDPVITVNSAANLSQFFNSYSPYADATLKGYPRHIIERFMQGTNVLDPVTTLFMMRRGTQDRTSVSYLRRLLPMYMLEKTLFRGTLVEASKRQKATTHIQLGDDTWEPTNAEMATVLGQFQESDMDPLGAWVVTRQGVQVQDIRQGGEMWKWTDSADTLVPYKLRALGISEAFMSSDANYSNQEAALTMFLDNMETYRQYVTYKMFDSKLFPLIAVLRGFYKDPGAIKQGSQLSSLLFNLNNSKNLDIPRIQWHKNLTSPNATSLMDNLDKLSEKGFPISLKTWAAAANVDLGAMLSDLEQDKEIRDQIATITGTKTSASDPSGIVGEEGGSEGGDYEESSMRDLMQSAELRPGNKPQFSRRKSLLDREFGGDYKFSKTGKMLPVSYQETQNGNDRIVKAMKALQDPHHLSSVKKQIISKLGGMPKLRF